MGKYESMAVRGRGSELELRRSGYRINPAFGEFPPVHQNGQDPLHHP